MQATSLVQKSTKLWGFTAPKAWPKSFENCKAQGSYLRLELHTCPDTCSGKHITLVTTHMFMDDKLKNEAVKESKEAGDSGQ